MPNLEFRQVLNSPYFRTTVDVRSEMRLIGGDGMAKDTTPTVKTISAIVYPGSANLRRLDDGSRITGVVNVITQYRLSAGGRIDDVTERMPDVVTWHGRDYVVASSEDYTDFGSGFFVASCDQLPLNPTLERMAL